MTAVDTSVVVPGLLAWHEHHELCRPVLREARIAVHALIESYSVLTRLPSPHRVSGSVAAGLLGGWFDDGQVLTVPSPVQRDLVRIVETAGIEGGAVYDALIALTARHADEVLITRDRRAAQTYEALGVEVRTLG